MKQQNQTTSRHSEDPKNSSSPDYYRLTQYYAIRSTMHCKVPAIYLIFVMQTIRKETITLTKQLLKPKYMTRSINQLSNTLVKGFKTFSLVAATLLTIGISSSFATPKGGDDVVTTSFRKDFKKAELLSSETSKVYTKLTFKMNDMVMFAYYNTGGQLIAVVRNIKSSQLPIQLMLKVKLNYADSWISDLFEVNAEGSSCYYITLEDANNSVTLRSSDATNWEVYSKKTKE
jgi:hypothetical protein